jgi:hypothetical protein
MRYFLIADTHWGHTIIQKHCRRPANVDKIICENWNRLVGPDDFVLHLGDVAFSFIDLKEWMSKLNGIKVLVRGNHDPHTVSWYMRNGFSFACDGLILGGIFYTHGPSPVLPNKARLNVHGHIHNTQPRGYRRYPYCRLFALEYENYEPKLIPSFLRSIEKEPVVASLPPKMDEENSQSPLTRPGNLAIRLIRYWIERLRR